nr:translation initiation factor IF-2 isoform X1 [Pan troglodytes]
MCGAFSPVHGRGPSTPSCKAGFSQLGFRRGPQQMGDNLWLGLRAQDPWRALRPAQSPRACRPHADCGDQGFRRKAQTPRLAPPTDHKVPEQRDEGAVHWLSQRGPARPGILRTPAPTTRKPPPRGSFPGSNCLDEEPRAVWPAFHSIRPGRPGPPPALSDHLGAGLSVLSQDGAVRIPPQGLPDLLELRRDAPGLEPRPAAAAPTTAGPRAARQPGDLGHAAPGSPVSGSGVLQPPAAPAPAARPLLPAGGALGRPALEAPAGHLQRAESLQYRELQLWQLEAGAGVSRQGQPRPQGRAAERSSGPPLTRKGSGPSLSRPHYVYWQRGGGTSPDTHSAAASRRGD